MAAGFDVPAGNRRAGDGGRKGAGCNGHSSGRATSWTVHGQTDEPTDHEPTEEGAAGERNGARGGAGRRANRTRGNDDAAAPAGGSHGHGGRRMREQSARASAPTEGRTNSAKRRRGNGGYHRELDWWRCSKWWSGDGREELRRIRDGGERRAAAKRVAPASASAGIRINRATGIGYGRCNGWRCWRGGSKWRARAMREGSDQTEPTGGCQRRGGRRKRERSARTSAPAVERTSRTECRRGDGGCHRAWGGRRGTKSWGGHDRKNRHSHR